MLKLKKSFLGIIALTIAAVLLCMHSSINVQAATSLEAVTTEADFN